MPRPRVHRGRDVAPFLNRRDDAAALIERVREDAMAHGQPRMEAASLDLLALLRYHKGEPDEAFRLGERALAEYRRQASGAPAEGS